MACRRYHRSAYPSGKACTTGWRNHSVLRRLRRAPPEGHGRLRFASVVPLTCVSPEGPPCVSCRRATPQRSGIRGAPAHSGYVRSSTVVRPYAEHACDGVVCAVSATASPVEADPERRRTTTQMDGLDGSEAASAHPRPRTGALAPTTTFGLDETKVWTPAMWAPGRAGERGSAAAHGLTLLRRGVGRPASRRAARHLRWRRSPDSPSARSAGASPSGATRS